MKKSWKIFTIVAVIIVAAACVVGGKMVADQTTAARVAASKRITDAAQRELEANQESVSNNLGVLDAVETSRPLMVETEPVVVTPPAALAGDETIITDENGNVTIIPNWEKKAADAKFPGTTPSTNMNGSGGEKLDLEDGVYKGDHPSETPAPTPVVTPAPTSAPASPDPSEQPIQTPAPSAAPDEPTDTPKSTPEPTPTPAPTQKPAPTPKPSQPDGGPPADSGNHKDGDVSPDGKYEYWEGFGWGPIAGPGVSIPGSDVGGTELSGEKVGNM